jgi:hypothetical protein
MRKLIIILAVMASCSSPQADKTKIVSENDLTAGKFEVIADTITYDVIIKNPSKDDAWTESCLKDLKRDDFINSILDMIQQGKLIAYDYETNQPLQWAQIEKMKSENKNKMVIGKIQFKEVWAFDKVQMRMYKKIHSAIFGYETYTDEGEVRNNYKAAFRIIFK